MLFNLPTAGLHGPCGDPSTLGNPVCAQDPNEIRNAFSFVERHKKQKHITYMNVLLNTAIIGIICANVYETVYTGSNIRPNKQFYQSNIISFPLKSAVYSYRSTNKSIKPITLFASLLLSVISQMFDGFFP